MKIVYVSHIIADGANGLCWSVPESVKAQSAIDDVYWLNTGEGVMEHWKKVSAFHDDFNYRWSLLKNLPAEYKKPDIVVFEGFYDSLLDVVWARELRKRNIPYIIVPRSALTESAMNNHARFKKKIAHCLFYNRFIKRAAAIHFLTRGEAKETVKLFDLPHFIIPNGISIPSYFKKKFSQDHINATFIGRIDIHQKGLDLLFEAMSSERDILDKNGFHLNIYGPKSSDTVALLQLCKFYSLSNFVSINQQIFGKDKEKVLLDSDLFILTSRFEGLPMGLIEALSYGVPCAVTDGTYLGEEIFDNKAGWVSNISVIGISKMLKNICINRTELMERGKNAQLLSKKYDWSSIAKRTHYEYLKLIK